MDYNNPYFFSSRDRSSLYDAWFGVIEGSTGRTVSSDAVGFER